jgi:hypothetical protein
MNPKNIKDLFDKIQQGNIPPIIKRFNLDNPTVVQSMYGYLNYIIEGWLGYKEIDGSYEKNALAQLIAKSMSTSMKYLEDNVPFELTSRYLATYMSINKLDCDYYFKPIITDAGKRNEICAIYRFENIQSV